MTDEKHEQVEAQDLDEAELDRDLDVKDADETDAISGGLNPQPLPPGIRPTG